jgi:HrpA-like RNA helicase
MVDWLRARRHPQRPWLPRAQRDDDLRPDKSAHDTAHQRRKFLQRLVAWQERQALHARLHPSSVVKNNKGGGGGVVPVMTTTTTAKLPSDATTAGTKVRFDLLEAVYPKGSTTWKAGGTKKLWVLDRATPIRSILQQAKTKLQMKKKAVRCFYVETGGLAVDLTHDLQGLPNGALLYVTSWQPPPSVAQTVANGDNDDEHNNDNAEEEEELPDPLGAVKALYAQRAGRRQRKAPVPSPIPLATGELPELPPGRAQLPAAAFRSHILSALDNSRVLIICGATGCGKSTQIPQYILEAHLAASHADGAHILVTQPRRVAATALASRVAVEQGSPAPGQTGSTIGHHVRLDAAVSDTTRITYLTVGILLRSLTAPTPGIPLAHVSHVIIDEVHERDINTDFCLTILRRVLVRNPHVKLIIMSATHTPDLFYRYFCAPTLGITPVILEIPGRTFPVETRWLPEMEALLGQRMSQGNGNPAIATPTPGTDGVALSSRVGVAIDNAFVTRLIFHLVEGNNGPAESSAILVFLPGRGEIEALARLLRAEDKGTSYLTVHILHSGVSQTNQKAVFQPAQVGRTKVVLATNVAETSITIPDVSHVIDTGRVKESRYNSSARIKELVTVWTSRASATQRAGRAGRTRPGVCYRLYTEEFSTLQMLERTTPEILRTPLAELVLQACLLEEDRKDRLRKEKGSVLSEGTAPVDFLSRTPDPPPMESLVHACLHLVEIDAIQHISGEDGSMRVRLTPLGYHLSQLPMDAKVGKILVVGSILGCVESSLTVAAALSSTKNIFWSSMRDKQKELIECGYGGANWKGGTIRGDCIASIAAFEQWRAKNNDHHRFLFAKENGLDHNVLTDIRNLSQQFRDCLVDAGFLGKEEPPPLNTDNAQLVSCCLVAGLYPNVATLMRPSRGKLGFRGGRLLTKDGDVCIPGGRSFQAERIRNASESGSDKYVVYQSKNRSMGASQNGSSEPGKKRVFLEEVNFVSRFALLLFGGSLEVRNNFLVSDDW